MWAPQEYNPFLTYLCVPSAQHQAWSRCLCDYLWNLIGLQMWVPGYNASHWHWTLTYPRRCRPGRRGAGCSTVSGEQFPPHTGDLTGRQGFRGSCCLSGAAHAAGMQTLQRVLGRKQAGERHTENTGNQVISTWVPTTWRVLHRIAGYMQDKRKSELPIPLYSFQPAKSD